MDDDDDDDEKVLEDYIREGTRSSLVKANAPNPDMTKTTISRKISAAEHSFVKSPSSALSSRNMKYRKG